MFFYSRFILLLLSFCLLQCFNAHAGQTTVPSSVGSSSDPSEYSIQAQLSPLSHTVLSSEIDGRIKQLSRREGQRFKRGDTLVSLDCSIITAHLQKARAEVDAAEKIYSINQRLDQLDGNSLLDLEQAAAKHSVAKAELQLIQTKATHCKIKAPFNGRVVTWLAEPHQFVASGTPLLEIVDPDNLEIRLIVPSNWLRWLNEKTAFNFQVEEIQQNFSAQVTQVGSVVDPVSQSVPVAAKITSGPQNKLLPGMSGKAVFTRDK